MLQRAKLEKLTEEEYGILYYCVNDGTDGDIVKAENMVWLRPEYAFFKLNEYASKFTQEKKHVFQNIVDKI